MKCYKCFQDTTYLINGLCANCYNGNGFSYYSQSQQFNYKCPNCQGEYNEPSYGQLGYTSSLTPKCPFCGRIMEGIC